MVYDGTRALVIGTYFGEPIGPWRYAVEPLGIEPKSTLMKSIFVVYGATWLVIIALYLRGVARAAVAMVLAAVGALWYFPFGTIFGAIQLVLWEVRRRRRPG
jgi:hypothetical protein